MTDKDWEDFYKLLSKLTDSDGAWQNKKEAALVAAKRNDAETQLDEFVNWFHGSTEV